MQALILEILGPYPAPPPSGYLTLASYLTPFSLLSSSTECRGRWEVHYGKCKAVNMSNYAEAAQMCLDSAQSEAKKYLMRSLLSSL